MQDARPRTVAVGGGALTLPVPVAWAELDPLDGVPFLARDPGGEPFHANVTVTVGARGATGDAPERGRALAAGLRGGALVAADEARDGGAVLTVVHDAGARDVVVVQRQLEHGEQQVAVSYSIDVEAFPALGPQVRGWAEEVAWVVSS